MKTLVLTTLILSLVCFHEPACGQESPAMPKPTQEHEWLVKFVGEWTTESKATMAPDQPPMQCTGTLTSRKLGGFWVLNEMKGEWSGDPMTGVQTIGYDEGKQKYVGTWVDSATAFMWQYTGNVDATGKVLTLEADGPNFMGDGKLTKFQDIYEFKSADEISMTSRMLDANGDWVTFMSGAAKRVK
ncbi:DUF1579 domain-containing protein [Stieleria varia]|uniref:DUF1579 domain-containing protein n=2 Tax=Stieleria varia TaxID=2528005 RepID=A0A5C6AXG0_9BACT|nr:DUF1579 domain-containing protein [Stieleria varia]TWU04623.1 hypothetical protein Pla52n_26650 [Stieleria varia]